MKKTLLRIYWIARSQFGLDPRRFLRAIVGLPRYIRDLTHFRRQYTGNLELLPCLTDWYEEGGTTKSEYFWQDLIVARMIYDRAPVKHVDIGSRIDGFVGHVASFREIEVFDVRPITTSIPGIEFRQADLMQALGPDEHEYCDSLSCLHALEHFGLGRYGDPVDVEGFDRGLANLAALLKKGGVLYLAVPVGEARVEFNGHRVCDPHHIVRECNRAGLQWASLVCIGSEGERETIDPQLANLDRIAAQRYSLGVFTFEKPAAVR